MRLHHALPVLLAAFASCGGDSTTVAAEFSSGAPVDALLGAGSAPDLFALSATLDEVRLVRADGSTTPNLLGSPMQLELVSLDEVSEWVAGSDVPVGIYVGGRATFAPGSVSALDLDGSELSVVEDALDLDATFDAPLIVSEQGYGRWRLALDLVESLQGSAASPPFVFRPVGTFHVPGAGDPVALSKLLGLVVGASLPAESLQVEVYRSDGLFEPLRVAEVLLTPDTVLVDLDDTVFDSQAAFYAALGLGSTVVRIGGHLTDSGALAADVVEIVDQGGGAPPEVAIAGLVLYHDAGADEFVLLVQSVVQGAQLAEQVLLELGSPSSIDVAYGPDTAFFLSSGAPASPADLAAGQKVVVEFAEFDEPPFPAAKVVINAVNPNVTGVIHDVSGLPESFVLDAAGNEPGYGDHITVFVQGAALSLDIQGKPAIDVHELVVGMKATVKGTAVAPWNPDDGETSTAGIDAESVRVHHGHFIKGDVVGAAPEAATFWTSQSQIVQTFGVLVSEGPLEVVVQPGCEFQGDAHSAQQFFALLGDLEAGVALDIKVKGVGSPYPHEVHAYEVKVKAK